MILQIVLQLLLILLNALFACAEIAVLSVNDVKLANMVANGEKRAIRLARLTSQPARFLATIQVAITLSGFLGSAFAADNFSDHLVHFLVFLGVPWSISTLDSIAVLLITLLLSFFTLVFGELVPKRIAMKKAERLALGMSTLITLISHLFAPVVWLLTLSTNGILHLIGIDPTSEEDDVSEEEIRMMVDVGSEKGVIDPQEKEMIQNVFEFDDITVSEFATHRTDISLLWLEESVEDWEKTIHDTRHSLYPICEETVDHVIGVLNAKDYFRLESKTKETILEHAVKPAYFVPETVCADVLFRQMKKKHTHFAVVLDEYGGMVGIVTMNDLLEQLVGDLEINDSDSDEAQEIDQLDASTWKIRGCTPLLKVAKELSVSLPLDDFDTFSGFIFGMYGCIPEDGTTFEITTHTLHIQVLSIVDHKIDKTIVCIKTDSTDE